MHLVSAKPEKHLGWLLLCVFFSFSFISKADVIDITSPGDLVSGVPDDNSWVSDESPAYAIDNNSSTKYRHPVQAGQSAGLRVTPSRPHLTVIGLTFTSANDLPGCDPVKFELYGSNTGINGTYDLIVSGDIDEMDKALEMPRYTRTAPVIFNNSNSYSHYQLLFPETRDLSAQAVQIAEVELLGFDGDGSLAVVDAGSDMALTVINASMLTNASIILYDNSDPEDVALEWQLVSAPQGVVMSSLTFTPDRFSLNTKIDFPMIPGIYELVLMATLGENVTSDYLTVVVTDTLCPTGDINHDCLVDIRDLEILAREWLDPAAVAAGLDGDHDGVDLDDFAVLASNWAKSGPRVVINEFMAVNTAKEPLATGEILDEDHDSSDWIELVNVSDEPVDLTGWYLTSDPTDLKQWEIPQLNLAVEDFYIIFASGKDRAFAGEELHTNFTLSSGSGFLALVEPDGQTIAHQYNYPAQYGSMSYGIASPDTQAPSDLELISPGAPAYAFVPADDTLALSWVQPGFNAASWLSGTTGIGYERSPGSSNNFTSLIGLNVDSNMSNSTTAYIRVPFNVTDLTGLRDLVLSMKYDDGFVAYLNGIRVASVNAPDPLVWYSNASGFHDDADAVVYQEFALSPEAVEYLHVGENVLAIHGLNENTGSSDFIILPRLTCTQDRNVSIAMQNVAYFPAPTPAGRNNAGQINLGPQVRDMTENPAAINADQDLVITARVAATSQPVAQVDLVYVVGYNDEVVIPMSDNGQGPDTQAADGIYTAVIPASAYNAGDMVRWCVLAYDIQGGSTREPLYLLTENSPRYYGTVINNTGINTNLTVLHCFTQNPYAANTDTGTRCSVYYLGEFYDNVFIRHRGGYSTNGNKIEFNDGRHFRFDPAYGRVDEINLNEKGNDPTYIRPVLAFETYEQAGIASSLAYPVHVRLNNSFLGVRIFIEQPDSHLLRRVGLDDNGAFYKVYNDLGYNTGNVEPDRKITRLYEDSSDLYALREGIDPGNPDRNVFLFDNVNLPAVISYMAANTLVHENDAVEKNYFLYRDTVNTGEWQFIPWDKDLTFGINMGVDGIATNQDWPTDLQRSPSHPFFGSVRHQKSDYKWNRLIDAVIADPVARQMYVRRLRSLMDSQLQPANTPASLLKYEARVDELVALLTPELYNSSYQTNINLLKNTYLPGRRHHLYVNHLVGSTWPDDPAQIPQAQPSLFWLQIGAVEYNPTSWNQDEEYIEIINPNSFAADISGWTVTGAVEHTFPGGTVIPANGKMYITPNALAFRSRAVSPKGGEHLFVQGNYKGHLSNWGETINIIHPKGNVLATKTYVGNPTAVQRYLRISEIMYHPLDSTDPLYESSDYEYLELVNAGPTNLSLDGVVFTKGISYSFPAGTELTAGEYILLVKNLAAFNSRYTVDPAVRIFSGYEGNLSNAGEIIAFDDQTNSSVLDFEYKDNWYDITDGQGFSLTFAAALDGLPDLWSEKGNWRASTFSGGSPGAPEQGLTTDSIVINELMSHSHASQPDWIELYNKTSQNINIGGWFLTDDNTDFTTIRKYEIPANTVIAGHGYLLFSQDTSFGSSSQPESKRFGLSEAGETVYLFSGQNGDVTGYYQTQQKFDAAETGVSFGRFEKASLSNGYDFVRMATATPLAVNSSPIIPGVVITELMYDPSAGTDSEYVELYNRSDSAVTLMTEVSTEAVEGVVTTEFLPWRIEGTGYEFPVNVTLAAGERIIVSKKPATFASTYAGIVPAGTRVFGPYSGKLSNEGEDIQLQIPGDQEYGKSRIYIPIEKVEYSDSSPWPANLEASGYSLARIYTMTYADDPANWRGATPSPGM